MMAMDDTIGKSCGHVADVLAEFIAANAVGRAAGLGETGLPLRRAVMDVIALWPA